MAYCVSACVVRCEGEGLLLKCFIGMFVNVISSSVVLPMFYAGRMMARMKLTTNPTLARMWWRGAKDHGGNGVDPAGCGSPSFYRVGSKPCRAHAAHEACSFVLRLRIFVLKKNNHDSSKRCFIGMFVNAIGSSVVFPMFVLLCQ
jgi:hypothetical protein